MAAAGWPLRGFSSQFLVELGADYGPLIWRGGQPWRVFSSLFVHIDVMHLALNLAALGWCGRIVEKTLGARRLAQIFVAAGLAGSLASAAWHFRAPIVSAGASAGIAGILGAGLVAGLRRRELRIWLPMLFVGLAGLAWGFWAGADNSAHLAGFAVGAALGLAKPSHGRLFRDATALTIAVAATFAAAYLDRARSHTISELERIGDTAAAAKLRGD
jgi:rhomboid protease GluP